MKKMLMSLVVLASVMTAEAVTAKKLYGKAYDLKKTKVLYHEVHDVTIGDDGFNQKVETKYLDISLKEFAALKSTFKDNLFVPDSELKDSRLKRTEKLNLDGNKAKIQVVTEGQKDQTKTISIDSTSVAGQGFNNFLLKYFDELATGKSKKVAIVVIPLLDFFKFTASRVGPASEREEAVEFKIQIASVFLKAFADPIFVKYDKKTRNLLEFRGLSNLSDEKDQKQQVLIQYSDSPPTL